MCIIVYWDPESGKFHDIGYKPRPMAQLQPLFENVKNGKMLQAEVEQAQREDKVLIQYITISADLKSESTSVALTVSEWERENSSKLARKFEKKCNTASPIGGDHFYKSLMDRGYGRIDAQRLLSMQALCRGTWVT